ncbi:hypothetical protein [Lacisediminihabitans profunda]|uniref:Uncharacterized protein n=1 Tax=Lacisediminihabitans profunda TaxID=2594790 RepID=A0A5C8UWV5_9MICO|nr:hypothetical protein [Lacisediminihabitans profunda]TXN32165.1 hypothetical protein FVP33_04450 [Lacisediminihabitans profunda]
MTPGIGQGLGLRDVVRRALAGHELDVRLRGVPGTPTRGARAGWKLTGLGTSPAPLLAYPASLVLRNWGTLVGA